MEQIKQLEKIARLLEPDALQRGQMLNQVAAYAHRHLESITTAPAYYNRTEDSRALYDSPITEEGISIEQALTVLRENVDSVGINTISPRHLGYIPGGALFQSALGDYLAAISNSYVGLFYANPGAARMENMLLRWMAEIVGYPDTAAGHLSSGGSLANLTAIITARDTHGVTGELIGKSVVYLTEHAHHSLNKALHVAGLSACIKRTIPVDSHYRMDTEALDQAIVTDQNKGLHPWLVIASAGTTNTGTVDPLSAIGDITAARNLWFHIDGAYGAFFALCPEGQEILQGIEKSDSITLDPHKTLFLPYGTGALLVKDKKKLYASFNATADYLQDVLNEVDELSPADISPELTKHFRGLRLWLPLKLVGVAPFRAALSEKIQLARYFYKQVQKIEGFEVGPPPDLSVVTYRYVPKQGDADEFNQKLVRAIQQNGRLFISSTRIDGKLVLRAAIVCFRTHLDDINEALDILKRTAWHIVQNNC